MLGMTALRMLQSYKRISLATQLRVQERHSQAEESTGKAVYIWQWGCAAAAGICRPS